MHQWRDLKEPDLPKPSNPPISEGRPAKSTSDDRSRKSAPEASLWSAALCAAQQPKVTKLDQTRAEHGPKVLSYFIRRCEMLFTHPVASRGGVGPNPSFPPSVDWCAGRVPARSSVSSSGGGVYVLC
eukprot:6286753-Prymnesium_polylepis.2